MGTDSLPSEAWTSSSQQKAILSPKGHLAISGDTFGCYAEWRCYWLLVGEGKDAAKRPTVYKTVPTTKNYLVSMAVLLRLSPDMVNCCAKNPHSYNVRWSRAATKVPDGFGGGWHHLCLGDQ